MKTDSILRMRRVRRDAPDLCPRDRDMLYRHGMRMCLSSVPRLAARSWCVALCAALVAVSAACVQRPPPIRSSPGDTGEAPPVCPATTGIDERGDPACAHGCRWDHATRQCAPDPTAPPLSTAPTDAPSADPAPPAAPEPAPSGDPAPGELPQLPPPTKKSPSLSPSDSI